MNLKLGSDRLARLSSFCSLASRIFLHRHKQRKSRSMTCSPWTKPPKGRRRGTVLLSLLETIQAHFISMPEVRSRGHPSSALLLWGWLRTVAIASCQAYIVHLTELEAAFQNAFSQVRGKHVTSHLKHSVSVKRVNAGTAANKND